MSNLLSKIRAHLVAMTLLERAALLLLTGFATGRAATVDIAGSSWGSLVGLLALFGVSFAAQTFGLLARSERDGDKRVERVIWEARRAFAIEVSEAFRAARARPVGTVLAPVEIPVAPGVTLTLETHRVTRVIEPPDPAAILRATAKPEIKPTN